MQYFFKHYRRYLLALALMGSALPLRAETYSGKIDLVEAKADGVRFFARAQELHLYASAQYKDVLLLGAFHQTPLTIGFQPFPCPGGMRGKCGTVFLVTANLGAP